MMQSCDFKNKAISFIKKILLCFAFFFCFFGLTSCASVEKKGVSQNYECISCVYNSEEDVTAITWTSTLTNQSIYDIKQVYFKFDLYCEDEFIRTTDYVYWNIQIAHGKSNTSYRDFRVKGNITSAKINSWNADFSNLWQSYEPWFIGTIIGVVLTPMILLVLLIIFDGDLFEIFESGSMILYLFVPFALVLFGTGIASWISSNWVPICIIAGGILAIVILLGLIGLVFYIFTEFDLDLYIEGKYIALAFLGLLLIGAFVCGCIFWKWWACLIIIFSIAALILLMILIVNLIKKKTESYEESESISIESELPEDNGNNLSKETKIKTKITTFKSKITFNDIAGLDEAKTAFNEKVIMPFEHSEIYAKFGKKAGGGLLLYGLPGTGKTMFAEATSNELNAAFIPVKCSDIKSKWYGESEQKVKAIFTRAKRSKRAIIFFDEFEAIGAKRTDDGNNGNNDLVPEILAEMQGIGSSKSDSTILVIAATNKPWAIDSAFMRPGRFDEKIYIPLPDFEARKTLFEINLKKLPIANDLDFDYLADITDGFNGADIKEVCEKLKMSAINDSINKGVEQTIGMDDVRKIEKNIKSSVQQEDIEQLKAFEAGLK